MSVKLNVLQGKRNIWRLARFRLGPRLVGLDRAGNMICYLSFNKSSKMGWTAVAEADDNSGIMYPMHWKAALVCEKLSKDGEVIRLGDRRLRIHTAGPVCIKLTYVVIILCAGMYAWLQYQLFKQWLNPPAREGIHELEESITYYPRLAANSAKSIWTEAPVPDTLRDEVTRYWAAAKHMARNTAESYGYNPKFEEEERRWHEQLEQARAEQVVEESSWRRYAAVGVMLAASCLTLW